MGKGVLLSLRFSGAWRRVGMCLTLELGGWSSREDVVQSWSCEHTGVFKAGGMDDITTGKQFLLPKPEPCEPRGKLIQRLVKDGGPGVTGAVGCCNPKASGDQKPDRDRSCLKASPACFRRPSPPQWLLHPPNVSSFLGLPSSALRMFYFFRFLMTLLTPLILYSRAFPWTPGPTSRPAGSMTSPGSFSEQR